MSSLLVASQSSTAKILNSKKLWTIDSFLMLDIYGTTPNQWGHKAKINTEPTCKNESVHTFFS